MDRKTLTEMLRNSYMPMDDDQIYYAKEQFKRWLGEVDVPDYGSPITIQYLLVALIDEPGGETSES